MYINIYLHLDTYMYRAVFRISKLGGAKPIVLDYGGPHWFIGTLMASSHAVYGGGAEGSQGGTPLPPPLNAPLLLLIAFL